MLILSSLEHATEAFARFGPCRVISLLSEDEPMPVFSALGADHHLRLYVERDACAKTISEAARRRAASIIDFARNWERDGHILVHCYHGVSRSTAAAFIIMCILQPEIPESELAQRLREAAPHADPCPLIIAYADDMLGRDGRMQDAIEELCLPCAQVAAPISTLDFATTSEAALS